MSAGDAVAFAATHPDAHERTEIALDHHTRSRAAAALEGGA